MTKSEFQKKYHYYKADSEAEAKKEADAVNKEGIEGDSAMAVELGNLGWCLMLKSTVSFAEKNKIIPKQKRDDE